MNTEPFLNNNYKIRTARNTDGRGSDGGVWVVVGCGDGMGVL